MIKMNDYIIKKLKKDYYIAGHPTPLVDGQCVLFEGIKKKENDEQLIFIKDYSK